MQNLLLPVSFPDLYAYRQTTKLLRYIWVIPDAIFDLKKEKDLYQQIKPATHIMLGAVDPVMN